MVRRDRNKINNLRDDLKKFKENLWELENSDGFQFCSKYAEKCSKGNKFGFKIVCVDKVVVTNNCHQHVVVKPTKVRWNA